MCILLQSLNMYCLLLALAFLMVERAYSYNDSYKYNQGLDFSILAKSGKGKLYLKGWFISLFKQYIRPFDTKLPTCRHHISKSQTYIPWIFSLSSTEKLGNKFGGTTVERRKRVQDFCEEKAPLNFKVFMTHVKKSCSSCEGLCGKTMNLGRLSTNFIRIANLNHI